MRGDRSGQVDGEGGACSRRAVDGQPSAVAVEDVFDERKTESGSALGTTLGYIHAIKSLGQSRQVLRRDAGTVIAHAYLRLGLAVARCGELERDIDALAGRAIFERVLDQILEDAKELVVVAEHCQRICRLDIDRYAAVARQRLEAIDRLPHDRNKV